MARGNETAPNLTRFALRIHGMHCGGCVQSVQGALAAAPGVREAQVNLLTETAVVTGGDGVSVNALVRAVRDAGYDAEPLPAPRPAAASAGEAAGGGDELRRHRQALIQAAMYALPILALDHSGPHLQAGHAAGALGWRLLQAALAVMLLISPAMGPILAGGFRAAARRSPNMDTLVGLGVAAALLSSVAGTLALRPGFIHYHAAAMIVLLVNAGRYLEARARSRATAAMTALARRVPVRARVRRGDGWVEVGAENVIAGDVVQMSPHAAIPTDGEVLEGAVSVDESLMTGEAMPVTRRPGDALLGGSLVVEGVGLYRATRGGAASALARILDLVRAAQATRTEMQRLADRVAAVFTPIVVLLAGLTFCAWMVCGAPGALGDAVRCAIAVLVVACPCAMGLATPTVVVVATAQAALRGILVRDAATLEALGRVDTVIWDKTGTLTAGRPAVVLIAGVEGATEAGDGAGLLRLAAAAEQLSVHPLGRAIVAEARRRGLALPEPSAFESRPGGGVRAVVDGHPVIVGSLALLDESGVACQALSEAARAETGRGRIVCYVAVDGRPAGWIALEDPPRPSACEAIARLRNLGLTSIMLTGDDPATAASIAARLGIRDVRAGVSPAEKARFVEEVRQSGRRVAMIGDGVNDAPALAAADVGVAFATGADVALASAGINLVGSTPHLVAHAVELARRGVRIIRQNLFWAFIYNVLMLPAAATGHIPPGWAAGAMMLSSLTVVLNALRLRLPRSVPPME